MLSILLVQKRYRYQLDFRLGPPGYYTFTYTKNEETQTLPARYSFVYVKRNGQWMIVDHHSSAMPLPPK